MLAELNVKDIALIRHASISLGEGLNILTGETGTGKSVIIGSAMLALGAKARGEIIRKGAEYGYVELVFEIKDEKEEAGLRELGAEPEEGMLVISRRIYPGRSISQINGETVTIQRLREVSRLLIDIYGQDEHRSLMSDREHLKILDDFIASEIKDEKDRVAGCYDSYKRALEEAQAFDMDESQRLREQELCEYEIDEIDQAAVKDGEEEELSLRYRRLSNAREVIALLGRASELLKQNGCGEAMDSIRDAMRYDRELLQLFEELGTADSIINTVLDELLQRIEDTELDQRSLEETEERLELVRRIQQKYGGTGADIRSYRDQREQRLLMLRDYEENKARAEKEIKRSYDELCKACQRLSDLRKKGAERLGTAIQKEMKELNFADVGFELSFDRKDPGRDGWDQVTFVAALNPGEELRPLYEVASGGELSRIMLAIKTVLAETDAIPTLIFDEIDTGISGRTAQLVSEKLCLISRRHQVICITHLPQIASMADCHYVIRKDSEEGRSVTNIERLSEEESIEELARLLSGARITASVRENAAEMKRLAGELKARLA